MKTGRTRLSAAIGVPALALMAAVGLHVTNAQPQVNTGAPPGSQIKPSHTDLSTLIIVGYESPETSTVVAKPASAP